MKVPHRTHSDHHKKSQLSTSLEARHLSMMAIAGVIGAALFVGSGSVIAQAGPASVLAYIAGGTLVILIMRMLGEMAASNPDSGSFSTYADKAIGHWAGFTIGWLYWWFWTLIMPWEAYVGGMILHSWFPGIGIAGWTALLTLTLASINFMQVKHYGEMEFWFSMIKVVAIVLFMTIGTLAVLRIWPWGHAHGFTNLTSHGGFMPNGPSSVVVALLGVMFSFMGAEIVTIAAAETKDPATEVERATRSLVWRISIFYVGSIFLIVCLVPWNDPLLGQSGFGSFRRTLELLGIPYADYLMNFVVLTAVSSCFISAHYTCSRMMYSLAKRGDAPALLKKTNPNLTPIYAVAASTIMAIIIGALNFCDSLGPQDILGFLMKTTGMIALLVYLVIACSQLRLRRKLEESGQPIRLRMWLFPYLTYASIIFIISALGIMVMVPHYRVLILSTGAAALLVALAGFIVQRYQSRNTLSGSRQQEPEINELTGEAIHEYEYIPEPEPDNA